MAKATNHPEVVETIVTKPGGVTLELSELEAKLLHQLLTLVGGTPDDSPRKIADDIRVALEQTDTTVVWARNHDDPSLSYVEPESAIYYRSGTLDRFIAAD